MIKLRLKIVVSSKDCSADAAMWLAVFHDELEQVSFIEYQMIDT